MNFDESFHEQLLRFLDGSATLAERAQVEAQLRSSPEARALLREIAEQAVLIADIDRAARARRPSPRDPAPPTVALEREWRWRWAVAACLLLGLGAMTLWIQRNGRELGRVVKVTGPSSYFGTRGAATDSIRQGISIRAGDVLETRSCDSWIEVALRDGTHLTIAGQSTLRLLAPSGGVTRLELPRGNLWSLPDTNHPLRSVVVRTPAAVVEARGAQFDMQAAETGAFVRVNAGSARAVRTLDGVSADVANGQQALLTFNASDSLQSAPQPPPVTTWAGDSGGEPAVILGRWLSPNPIAKMRLAAVPLLWPIPDRSPVTLYVVGLSVTRSVGQPVLLLRGSQIHVRGQTSRSATVRVGFSTQRMRGVFAGKFELDVPASELGSPDEPWDIRRGASDFRPLQPQLAASPEGLELYDLYALTIREDAGLEIHQMKVTHQP